MTAFRDHKVKYLTREQVAATALAWWKLAERRGHTFNICKFVTDVLVKRLGGKGPLKIKFYEYNERHELPERACVTFNPTLTLHIWRSIWDGANTGVPHDRFIVAHEIGHIVLHDQYAAAFSNDDEAKLNFLQKEESAEEQANAFADLFLAPDHVALSFRDVDTIALLCVVSDEMATRRLRDALIERNPIIRIYDGEICCKCYNSTLISNGRQITCDTCGNVTTRI
jgi:hypothetical protein